MLSFAIILLNLLATALLYGAAPLLLLRFRRSPLTKRTLKVYHISYTVLISFFCLIIQSLGGEQHSFAPAVLWGTLYYHFNVTRFTEKGLLISKEDAQKRREKGEETAPIPTAEDDPAAPESEKRAHVVKVRRRAEAAAPLEMIPAPAETAPAPAEAPEQVVPPKEKRRRELAALALAVLCLVSIAGNVYQASKMQSVLSEKEDLSAEIAQKNKSLSQMSIRTNLYKDKANELEEQIGEQSYIVSFAESEVGFVLDGDNVLYHNIKCPLVEEKLERGDGYSFYEVGFCEWLGLAKCPLCWKETPKKGSLVPIA